MMILTAGALFCKKSAIVYDAQDRYHRRSIICALFQRGARKITLTNEGMLLRRRAEEIVELVDRTVAELPLQEKEVEGTIAIGSGEVAGMEVPAQICSAFREKHPKLPFDLFTDYA